jgi:hypothetical protein
VTRNGLLAYAAEIAAVSGVLEAAARMVRVFDQWGIVAAAYKAADILVLLSSVVTIVAFVVAWAGLQRVARSSRLRTLSTGAGLYAVAAAFATAADLIRTVESISVSAAWKFTATEAAWTAGRIVLVAAAVLVALGLRRGDPDVGLGRASVAVGAYAGLFAVAYGFELAEVLSFPAPFSSSREATGGLGVIAGGWAIVTVAAVVAAAAFFAAGVRRARGDAWKARREGTLGRSALVFAIGFAVSAVGLALYDARFGRGAEQWLESVSDSVLAAAAGCAAVAFLRSRRRLELDDGSDLAVLPDES